MRIATTVVVALLLVAVVGANVASAQTPFIAVYFDDKFTSQQKDCPGPILDQLYVVLSNAGVFVSGAEYQILYPGTIIHLADTNKPPATVGSSPTGVALGFAVPQNGIAGSVLLHTVAILWNCSDCSVTNDKISVVPSPFNPNGKVQYTDWPNFDLFDAIGLDSDVCATVATEESTWGKVKALYSE
jgi:hypothetical protein